MNLITFSFLFFATILVSGSLITNGSLGHMVLILNIRLYIKQLKFPGTVFFIAVNRKEGIVVNKT
jgi:hypothetical protein